MTDAGSPGRRAVMRGLGALALGSAVCPGRSQSASPPPAQLSVPFPGEATLLTAGPEAGPAAGWAELLAPSLAQLLPQGTRLLVEPVGGEDGVTGANQFEVRAAPDGGMALVLPGSAALAWLIGDPRAKFDAATWIPALAAVSPGVLASRIPLDRLRPGQELRLAGTSPGGFELPALLALEMLGVRTRPVFGLTDVSGAMDAVISGTADAAFVRGRRVAEQVQALAASGAPAVLAMGAPEAAHARDPQFPGTPTVVEALGGSTGSRLYRPWVAAAAASQTDIALVLPRLTPAALVALWRRACAQAVASPRC